MTGLVLYAGGWQGTYEVVSGAPVMITTEGYFDGTFSDCALSPAGGLVRFYLRDADFAPTTVGISNTFFWHMHVFTTSLHDFQIWGLYTEDGLPVLQLTQGEGTVRLYYNSSTTSTANWVEIGSSISMSGNQAYKLDIELDMPATGEYSATLYLNGVATTCTGSFTPGPASGQPAVAYFEMSNQYDMFYSQILATKNQNTVGATVTTSRPAGAGAHDDWGGTYTNVNAVAPTGTPSDTTTSAGQTQTYSFAEISVADAHQISSVFLWVYGLAAGGGVAALNAVCRPASGSDVISSSPIGTLGTGLTVLGTRYDTDPSTGAGWSQVDFNTPVQFGYESVLG